MEEAKTCLATYIPQCYPPQIGLLLCCVGSSPLLPWTEFNGFLAGSSHTNGSPTTRPYWTP